MARDGICLSENKSIPTSWPTVLVHYHACFAAGFKDSLRKTSQFPKIVAKLLREAENHIFIFPSWLPGCLLCPTHLCCINVLMRISLSEAEASRKTNKAASQTRDLATSLPFFN